MNQWGQRGWWHCEKIRIKGGKGITAAGRITRGFTKPSAISTLTRSQLWLRSDLGLVNKPTGSTSCPPHTPSTPSWSTVNNALPSYTACPLYHPLHSRHLFTCPCWRFSFPTPSVHGSLAHSSWTPPLLCLDIVPYSLRHLTMTPDVCYLPFYWSLLLLLWSLILPEPQACLATVTFGFWRNPEVAGNGGSGGWKRWTTTISAECGMQPDRGVEGVGCFGCAVTRGRER